MCIFGIYPFEKLFFTGLFSIDMINFFHKLKHWQLFLLLFVLPVVLQLLIVFTMLPSFLNSSADEFAIFGVFKYFFIITFISIFGLFGWIWSIVIGLNSKVPTQVDMKLKRFKLFFFIPLFYLVLLSLFMSFFLPDFIVNLEMSNSPPDPRMMFGSMALIMPFHFLSIFSIFYCYYVAAKTLKSIEFQREAKFDEFIGEFVLLWINFVGVWILQPKINAMVENVNSFYYEGE